MTAPRFFRFSGGDILASDGTRIGHGTAGLMLARAELKEAQARGAREIETAAFHHRIAQDLRVVLAEHARWRRGAGGLGDIGVAA